MKTIEYFLLKFERLIINKNPIHILILGYLSYILIGLFFLMLPTSRKTDLSLIDNLFTVVSALSTTGLMSVTISDSYNFLGQIIILMLIQVGGIGYMTFGSFIILQTGHRFSKSREKLTRTAFPLPESLNIKDFLKGVIFFTLTIELLGAAILSILFWQYNFENPLWLGLFHSISAFCTAGLSLFDNSFLDLKYNTPIILTISILSILGAIGYIVFIDLYLNITSKRKELTFTSKVILKVTFLSIIAGTILFYILHSGNVASKPSEKILISFFQTMSSVTTVGFSSIDFSGVPSALLVSLYFFMLFGASPSGTGGGLKSTTLSALWGLITSTLKRSDTICFMKRKIPNKRLQLAASSFVFCILILWISLLGLSLTESIALSDLIFESLSAIGTVGLSSGITSQLSFTGKLIIISLMMIGRIGVLTFGLALAISGNMAFVDGDNDLVI